MINQNYKLNLIPDLVETVVSISQYDEHSRNINMSIYNGALAYDIPDLSVVTVRGTKPDNTGFEYQCTYTNNVISFGIEPQMSILSGNIQCEIRVVNDGEIIGSANFRLIVEPTPLGDVEISETELPLLEEAIQAAAIAQEAAQEATSVLASAVKSVNNESPDQNGNVNVLTVPEGGTAGQSLVKNSSSDGDASWVNLKILEINISNLSSLPKSVTNNDITSAHVVVNSVLSDPSVQTGDWTVTTSNGSLSIAGTINGSTNLTLYLGVKG